MISVEPRDPRRPSANVAAGGGIWWLAVTILLLAALLLLACGHRDVQRSGPTIVVSTSR